MDEPDLDEDEDEEPDEVSGARGPHDSYLRPAFTCDSLGVAGGMTGTGSGEAMRPPDRPDRSTGRACVPAHARRLQPSRHPFSPRISHFLLLLADPTDPYAPLFPFDTRNLQHAQLEDIDPDEEEDDEDLDASVDAETTILIVDNENNEFPAGESATAIIGTAIQRLIRDTDYSAAQTRSLWPFYVFIYRSGPSMWSSIAC